ncbi:TGF-beta-activated kinase 1 and MAP3K7-binding protein 1-like isoform X2 [Asterias rubens]|uniref:TGF-beta-activated kinase 1 and MAP3K7-binding protein 1-like isoform X2 n=1 Tax=Asterias rubens TaxID=7604 RepID=UPI001455026A|nr:TGF-beta-activated kinase 1 and MAP3K7-binding protein 1-like isoform X2 [Asterias rubens]
MATAAPPRHARKQISTPSSVAQSPAPSWTDDLPVCHLSGIGFSTNQIYRPDGGREEEHECEDLFFRFRFDDEHYLYGVFDGHDGMHVADFARLRLPAELLFGQLMEIGDDDVVKKVLFQAFNTVDLGYFESIDGLLAERTNLKLQLPEDLSYYELCQQYPSEVDKLQQLDSGICGGASANVALILGGKLYVANVGDSRTILCSKEQDGSLKIKQLSIDHTLQNEDEVLRLTQIGVDPALIQRNHPEAITTRQIGDHHLKGGYKEHIILSDAKTEPVIAEPEIIGGLQLNGICGFLAMFTNGLQKSLVDATGTNQPNVDIAHMIAAEFSVQSTLSGVAQGVVDKVIRIHHDTYLGNSSRAKACQKREDITLLVRDFGYPLGTSVNSPTMQYNPVTVPYQPGKVSSGHPPMLIIPPRPGFPGQASPQPINLISLEQMTPLSINVDPMSPASSRTSTIGSPTSSSVSTPCSNLNDTDPNTTQESRSNTNDSDTQNSGEEPFLFQRLHVASPRPRQPDEEGYIEPYVDFSEFHEVYAAAISDHQLSQ